MTSRYGKQTKPSGKEHHVYQKSSSIDGSTSCIHRSQIISRAVLPGVLLLPYALLSVELLAHATIWHCCAAGDRLLCLMCRASLVNGCQVLRLACLQPVQALFLAVMSSFAHLSNSNLQPACRLGDHHQEARLMQSIVDTLRGHRSDSRGAAGNVLLPIDSSGNPPPSLFCLCEGTKL